MLTKSARFVHKIYDFPRRARKTSFFYPGFSITFPPYSQEKSLIQRKKHRHQRTFAGVCACSFPGWEVRPAAFQTGANPPGQW